jgi:NitT/TauT family transport system substrate-binding protein
LASAVRPAVQALANYRPQKLTGGKGGEMKPTFLARWMLAVLLALGLAGAAVAQDTPGPIAVYGNKQTFEIAPVLLAAAEFYPGEASVRMGSIANLVGEPPVPGFGEEGVADVATNAETQLLRFSVEHPNLRAVMTVTEGLYRIVARRSAGIADVADLKGKRIATIAQTSSGYFLKLMLERAGLRFEDITAVPIVPLAGMTDALTKGEVDAVVIWEPESENAARALGEDAIEFSGAGVYRELFNLNTTAEALADPARRAKVVAFVRAIIEASGQVRSDPAKAKALVAAAGGFAPQDVEDSWQHHNWLAGMPDDLLDAMAKQEVWLAAQANRPARSREQLGTLIDPTVYAEALAQMADPAVETAKIEDLTSIREIKNIQHLWGYMALGGDFSGMADLLIEDARYTDHSGSITGREQIERLLRREQIGGGRPLPGDKLNIRLFLSPVITLAPDGQSATGRWHEIALTGEKGKSAGWLGGTHVIEYTKTEDGWRIAADRFYEQFAGPYDGGWRHDAATLERAPYHYTPDEAGRLLPERRARRRDSDDLDRDATLLLEESRAQNLVAAYGYYLDRGMYDDIADLFTEDAEAGVITEGAWRGRDGIMAFLARYGAPGLDEGELNDHPQLMPLVEIDESTGRTAKVTTLEIGMTGRHGGEGQWSAALMEFWLALGDDGKWRIARLWQEPVMRADYKSGWGHPLPASGAGGDEDLPDLVAIVPYMLGYPDTPPTLRFGLGEPQKVEHHKLLRTIPGALAMAEAFDGAENVSNAYGYYIDQFAWRNTADLFARDGWKELSYIGTFIGKDHVLKSLIQRYGEGGPNDAFQAIHQKTQPYVTVLDGGRRAMVRSRLWQFNSSSTGPGSWISGIYENQVVKEDGIWRIAGMDLDYVWLADYATGWTGIDPAASSRFGPTAEAIAAFAPDAPLRGETFAPYPRIAPMGFHFANPVSGREPAVLLHWSDGHR